MHVVRWSQIEEAQQHPVIIDGRLSSIRAISRYTVIFLAGTDTISIRTRKQAGYVLSGEMAMIFPEAPRLLSAGEAYVVPTSVEHGGKGSGDGEAKVVNLYVKRHLVRPIDDPVWCENWADGAPRETMSSGVIMRSEAFPHSEQV